MEKNTLKTISIAGAGNVGSFLAVELCNAGYTIHQIYSRTIEHASLLANKVSAQAVDDMYELNSKVDLLIVALPDRVITEFLTSISTKWPVDSRIASTAGAVSLKDLLAVFPNSGVLYPLQSFTQGHRPNPNTIPFCLEGCNDTMVELLKSIALQISKDIRLIDSDQRRVLHLSAVFACNFTNHMMTIANDILKENNIEFDILWPLINETVSRLKEYQPQQMQTGPAVRGDHPTITAHLSLLDHKPGLQEVYKVITQSIIHSKNTEK